MEVNEIASKEWNSLIGNTYYNGGGCIAYVIDNEVYSCPYVTSPIMVNTILIPCKTLEEAIFIEERINKSR